jgi:hypothetical protein
MMELELRLLESNAEEAEREEFYLIQRSFKVTGQKNLNSAASVTYFLPFKRQKKKMKESCIISGAREGGEGILQRKGPTYSSFLRLSQMEL